MFSQKHVIMGFVLLICIVPLYWAKTKADSMRENMQSLSKEVADEQKKISELEAEYAYLNRFDRLEAAANKLGLQPINGAQITNLSQLEKVAPLKTNQTPPVTNNPQPQQKPQQQGVGL